MGQNAKLHNKLPFLPLEENKEKKFEKKWIETVYLFSI